MTDEYRRLLGIIENCRREVAIIAFFLRLCIEQRAGKLVWLVGQDEETFRHSFGGMLSFEALHKAVWATEQKEGIKIKKERIIWEPDPRTGKMVVAMIGCR